MKREITSDEMNSRVTADAKARRAKRQEWEAVARAMGQPKPRPHLGGRVLAAAVVVGLVGLLTAQVPLAPGLPYAVAGVGK